jgi:hypothetical protein
MDRSIRIRGLPMPNVVTVPITVLWAVEAIPAPILENEDGMWNELDRILNVYKVPLEPWELWNIYMEWTCLDQVTLH